MRNCQVFSAKFFEFFSGCKGACNPAVFSVQNSYFVQFPAVPEFLPAAGLLRRSCGAARPAGSALAPLLRRDPARPGRSARASGCICQAPRPACLDDRRAIRPAVRLSGIQSRRDRRQVCGCSAGGTPEGDCGQRLGSGLPLFADFIEKAPENSIKRGLTEKQYCV